MTSRSRTISIRALCEDDRAGWELLWQGYQEHLRAKASDAMLEDTWKRLMNGDVALFGLVGCVDTFRIAGLVHYSFSPSSWSPGPLCQIQDLYVAEKLRGIGVGQRLVQGVFAESDAKKASQVFWHLPRSDFRAKLLLDSFNVAPEGMMMQARRKLARY